MNFLELLQVLGGNIWIYGGTFLLILSLLVFVHEWGHYIVARWCGVKVETFSIGFGKEIAGFEDKKGTRWKIALIPLGGYVKLFGDVDPASAAHEDSVEDKKTGKKRKLTKKERDVAFFAKPVWQRMAVVFAGPAINYIFAIIVLTLLFSINGQPVTAPSAAAVMGGSSAEKHGFMPHDTVLSIDGKKIKSFEDIRREMMISLDQKRHFVIDRNGQTVDIYAQPEKVETEDRFGFKHSRGLLGLISPRHAVDIKTIQTIEGQSFKDADGDKIRRALERRMDKMFTIEVMRGSETDTLIVKPLAEANKDIANEESPDYNLLFIASREGNIFVRYNPFVALGKATAESWSITQGTFEALGQIVMGTRSATELGGIIRIGALAGDMAQQGFIALCLFTALLSINLGFINLMPIPLLDGGHLVFYTFELILGKPIPDQIQEYAFRLGLMFLVGIMVFANLNDLMQLIL